MEAITREELYLAYLAGNAASLPTPITRKEMYLAYLCGKTALVPEPITREEQFLYFLCMNAEGGAVRNVEYVVGTVMGGKLEDWNDYQKTRMSAVLTEGEVPFPTSFTTPYYLIPVPAEATALTVTCPGLHGGPQFFNLADGAYTLANDAGWQALDGFTYAIDAGAYGFVAINFKNAANGDFTDDYDTSQIVIRFQ